MHVLVGLGNPGSQYAFTRHNFGFMAVDAIQRTHNFEPFKKKFSGEISLGQINDQDILLLKPMTFMNLSGKVVAEALTFYKIPITQVTVFHDDLNLAPFQVKTKQGGGAGGHNGLRSMDQHCGSDYFRIRLGIGNPGVNVAAFVLSSFDLDEKNMLPDFLEKLVNEVPALLKGFL